MTYHIHILVITKTDTQKIYVQVILNMNEDLK